MEGGSDFEGRVEMCLSSRWGTIGGNGWTQTNSDVVCNALGYEITSKLSCSYSASEETTSLGDIEHAQQANVIFYVMGMYIAV